MDLKQLEYFVTVINEGTISSAARKLNLSQPPLSAQMKSLEQEIGSQLFFRGPRQIELTEAGRILYERSKDILDLSSRTLQELSDYREGKSGVLRIGIVSSAHDKALSHQHSVLHSALFVHFMSNFLKFVLNYMKMKLIVSSNNYNPKFWILQLYVPLSNQII